MALQLSDSVSVWGCVSLSQSVCVCVLCLSTNKLVAILDVLWVFLAGRKAGRITAAQVPYRDSL